MDIPSKKPVFAKNAFENTVDKAFKYFIKQETETPVALSQADFWRLYDEFFYQIPKTGEFSHETLLNRSAEYLGVTVTNESIDELLNEVTELREQINIKLS